MWLFTKYGFFSAVCARAGNGEHGQPVDKKRIMVRARLREHLEALKARFPVHLDESPIIENVGTDYPVRLFVAKNLWAEIACYLANETDYDNFKSAVAAHGPKSAAKSDYLQVLHDVWADAQYMEAAQPIRDNSTGRKLEDWTA